jgi:hypothetical protein
MPRAGDPQKLFRWLFLLSPSVATVSKEEGPYVRTFCNQNVVCGWVLSIVLPFASMIKNSLDDEDAQPGTGPTEDPGSFNSREGWWADDGEEQLA